MGKAEEESSLKNLGVDVRITKFARNWLGVRGIY
jgi:hypothetical protein